MKKDTPAAASAVSDEDLMAKARAATARAYAPYSRFHVGAAVETEDGSIFDGVNIENASYGNTVCAERTAILAAVAAGHRRLRRIAVSCLVGPGSAAEERTPCGACRQTMVEFMAGDGQISIDGVGTYRLDQLLPLAFRLDAAQKPAKP
jgi:cytidine deaminase